MGASVVESKAKGRQGFSKKLRLIHLYFLVYLCCIAAARVGPVSTSKLLYADFTIFNSTEPVVHIASGDATFAYSVEHEMDQSVTLNPKSDSNRNLRGWAPANRITVVKVFNPAPTSRVFTTTVVVRDLACQQSPIVNVVGLVEGISMPTKDEGYRNIDFVVKIDSKQSIAIFLIIDGSCAENQSIEILSMQITW
jgi:hypothetical protein